MIFIPSAWCRRGAGYDEKPKDIFNVNQHPCSISNKKGSMKGSLFYLKV